MVKLIWWKVLTAANSSYLETLPHYVGLFLSRKLKNKFDVKERFLKGGQELEAREAY